MQIGTTAVLAMLVTQSTLTVAPLLAGTWLAALPQQQTDSQTVLRSAQRAQADFERARRWNLPYSFGHSGSACDERIGRFCYWHDEGEVEKAPPREPPRILEVRDKLILALDSAATAVAGDQWIAGQRVRYLVETGRHAAALAAARACQAARWWCEALAGFALHAAGDFAGADSTYKDVLRDMPPEERCRWTDLSFLLEGELKERYGRVTCEQRGLFEARLWWLAQPLYALPGNDRRTEHFARATMARMHQHARSTYGLSWDEDLREMTVRYGWPAYWTQETPPAGRSEDPLVVGHEPAPGFHFLPIAHAFEDPASSDLEDWLPQVRRPRERYAPAYAARLAPLEHRVALLRRGDSCLVVATYDLARDTLFAGLSLDAALVLVRDEHTAPVIARLAGSRSGDVLVAQAPWEPLLFSLEVVAATERRAARARYGLDPPDASSRRVSVSDLLVFDPPDSLPMTLAAVLPHLHGTDSARRDRRLGLFWEMYGLDPAGEVVTTSIAVVPARRGWLGRAAESLGFTGPRTPVRLAWQEVPESHDAVAGRALALDVSGLSPGRYRIELAIESAGQKPVTATREIRLIGP